MEKNGFWRWYMGVIWRILSSIKRDIPWHKFNCKMLLWVIEYTFAILFNAMAHLIIGSYQPLLLIATIPIGITLLAHSYWFGSKVEQEQEHKENQSEQASAV